MNPRCSRSLNTWSIFSKILRQDGASFLNLLRYHQTINAPNRRLDVYTDPLVSKSYEFVTSLSITIPVPISDLIKLPNVNNLGVLELINAQGDEDISVGDRLIRSWSVAALNDGAFSVLRILKLWNHEGLTNKSLAYLNSFPALAVYDVQGCGFDLGARVEAASLGWKPTLDTDILGLLETACAERVALMRTNLAMDARPPQVFCPEHLWHGAKVKCIRRRDMPAFFSQIEPPKQELPEPSRKTSRTSESEKSKVKSRHQRTTVAGQPRSKGHTEDFDAPMYRMFARIGELRNDTDLVRAGVAVGDQAVVGRELINSVPMASLRLGESPTWPEAASMENIHKTLKSGGHFILSGSSSNFEWGEKPRLATSTMQGLAFIRIKVPTVPAPAAYKEIDDSVNIDPPGVAFSKPPSTSAAPVKRHGAGIVKNKRRKLDDVLGSFL